MNDSPLPRREQFLDRSMPSDATAERCILGGILLDNRLLLECLERIVPGDFYGPVNRWLYEAMLEIFQTGRQIDVVTIVDELKRQGRDEMSVGGHAAIAHLAYDIPAFTSLKDWIDILIEKSRARKLVQICQLSTSESLAEEEDFSEILDRHEQLISELRNKDTVSHFVSAKRLAAETYEQISHFAKSGGKELLGIPTGYRDIDVTTSGLEKQDLIIVAARPSMGKSALALNIAARAATEHPEIVIAVFSLEMSRYQLMQRMISAHSTVDFGRIRQGMLTNPEWGRVNEAASFISDLHIEIDDTPAITTMQLKAKLRRLESEKKRLDMVVVDHLNLIKHVGDHRQSEHHRITESTKDLKAMAKEFDVPFMVLHQLSRAVEKRNPPRPILSDLRESGSIEEIADKVCFIYRPDYYLKDKCPEEDKNIAEIIIAKNRNGPTDAPIKLAFLKQYARFEDAYLP